MLRAYNSIAMKLATGVNKANASIKAGGEHWRRRLSGREHEALKLLADCKSNKEIASEMNISVRTAETYRARVMMKLELRLYRSLESALQYGTILLKA